MFPGMNPRAMKQAMKKLGMKQEEIEATEVIIKTGDKEIVFVRPQVSKIDMMGQETWQIIGESQERVASFGEDDVQTVMAQAQVDEEKARAALKESNGDLAEAIMALKSDS
jgi:nascent polypeptide-associated complex subunit alpha